MRFVLWAGGGLLTAAAVAAALVYVMSQSRMARVYDVPAVPVPVTAAADVLARGRHLAQSRGCTFCHAADLGGRVFIDDGPMGTIVAGNLTAGRGGVAHYSDAQLARAIRHGIDADGRSLLVMPVLDYFPLSDADAGALVSLLRSVPAVDREFAPSRPGPLARVMIAARRGDVLSADMVDHDQPRAEAPESAVTVEYGRYVAAVCMGCHGRDYRGGIVHGPPGTPASTDLTPAGRLRDWTEMQFTAALRQGLLPDGRVMDPMVMPWQTFRNLDEVEVAAIWAFLRSLPAH